MTSRSRALDNAERDKWRAIYRDANVEVIGAETLALSDEVLRVFAGLLPGAARILEAGCGSGAQSLRLAQDERFSVSLMDFAPEALEHARQLYVSQGTDAEFLEGDLFEEGLPEFDLVYNFGVLEHYDVDRQVEAVRAMASRSTRYVAAAVPNKRCYWYWIWRTLATASGNWPYGREVPLSDMREVFEAAGLRYLGLKFVAVSWTEQFISSIEGLDERLKAELLSVHRSPLLPIDQRAYLMLALGTHQGMETPALDDWSMTEAEPVSSAHQVAALSDSLAITIGLRRDLAASQQALLNGENESRMQQERLHYLQTRIEELSDGASRQDAMLEKARSELTELGKQLAEADRLRNALESKASAELTELRKQLAEADRVRNALESKASAELTELRNQLAEADRLRNALESKARAELTESTNQLAEADRLRNDWEYQARALANSNSWRVTKPLRMMSTAGRMLTDGRAVKRLVFLREKARTQGVVGTYGWLRQRLDAGTENRPEAKHSLVSLPSEAIVEEQSREKFLSMIEACQRSGAPVWLQLPIIDWNVPLYQRPQHIAEAIARAGAMVVYLTSNTVDKFYGYCNIKENIWITNDIDLVKRISGAICSVYSTAYATPLALYKSVKQNNVLLYEYIDHIDSTISGIENVQKLLDVKNYFFGGGADLVVASARQLEVEAIATVGDDRTVFVPNGVDYDHYRSAMATDLPTPEPIVRFQHRYEAIIGYFGALAPWLWYEMINEITEARPELGFVFIGPDYYGGEEQLTERPNVLKIGPIPYPELPAYAKQFDVAIIPFRHGDVAQTTSPLKLFEYFALEKPVVVTSDMRECTVYPEVFAADTAADFSKCLDKALIHANDERYRARLRDHAIANTWDERAKVILKAGQNALKSRGGARRPATDLRTV